MSRKALIIGGSGQIGQATARALAAAGWLVTAAQKRPEALPADLVKAGVSSARLDREEGGALVRLVYGGFDAVIDTVAYEDRHARQLLEVEGDLGALVVISSASVYRDDHNRTLDEARQTGFPEFPVPITEDQPTVAPGPETYSTRKIALEQTLLQRARRPVTILRPGAIYGPGSRHPREWWFVKRILDGRRRMPLAYNGESRFQQSATGNIAQLIRVALDAAVDAPGDARILNAGDPQALTVKEIGEAIAAAYGAELTFDLIPGPPKRGLGATPWSIAGPIVLDMTRAAALGYRPATTYAEAVGEACRSAEAAAKAGVAFPDYINALFDYVAEDAAFSND